MITSKTYTKLPNGSYQLVRTIQFTDSYGSITVPRGFVSDGATGAFDISSLSWWVHDWLCDQEVPSYDDGTRISPWRESAILSSILKDEGRYIRMVTWRFATFVYRSFKRFGEPK